MLVRNLSQLASNLIWENRTDSVCTNVRGGCLQHAPLSEKGSHRRAEESPSQAGGRVTYMPQDGSNPITSHIHKVEHWTGGSCILL